MTFLKANISAILGLVVGLASVVSYFGWVVPHLSAAFPSLREQAALNLALLAIALGLSIHGARQAFRRPRTHRGRVIGPIAVGLNLFLALGFSWYLFSISSRLPAAQDSPRVGDRAPNFNLTNDRGETIELASLRGRPVVLVFYRGHW